MSFATSTRIDEMLNFLSPTSYEMARRQAVYNEWVESSEAIAGTADNVHAIAQIATSASKIESSAKSNSMLEQADAFFATIGAMHSVASMFLKNSDLYGIGNNFFKKIPVFGTSITFGSLLTNIAQATDQVLNPEGDGSINRDTAYGLARGC